MNKMSFKKYVPFPPVNLPDRQWPSKTITSAPIWCSVDLRDGNQALVEPMNIEQKVEMFKLLVELGFKEIEVGFPAASQTEYDYIRKLIDDKLIPDDVIVQVLVQSREELIRKTFEALKGVKKAIIHLYLSTSTLQRKVVFKKGKEEMTEIALEGARLIKKLSAEYPDTKVILEFSPESFTGTELDFALQICEDVLAVWNPSPENKAIINLPATVEMSTPNIYADQVEWFSRNIKNRESIILSAHAHNDRGTSVAASELAMLAGADRIEGTLFGNGERTGNVDILTLALNLFSQGIDPKLDFTDINKVKDVYERCTDISVHIRHPYVGDLVYTAFSGSHQDAIKKGMEAYEEALKNNPDTLWEIPYLPIDPCDVGRTYESIIRINSQSGKGGVAYIMEKEFGFVLPKAMHPEVAKIIQELSDRTGQEILPQMVWDCFKDNFLNISTPIKLESCKIQETDIEDFEDACTITASVIINNNRQEISNIGNGPIDAFSRALISREIYDFKLLSYHEHATTMGSDSKAVAYIQIEGKDGKTYFGAGMDSNISMASIKALVSAINRSMK